MALLFYTGGETALGDADFQLKWSVNGVPTGTLGTAAVVRSGAPGTRSITIANSQQENPYLTFSTITTLIAEAWYRITRASTTFDLFGFQTSAAANHGRVGILTDTTNVFIQVFNSAGTQIGSNILIGPLGVWFHVGAKITVGDAGTMIVRVDDVERFNQSSDFKNGSSTGVDRLNLSFYNFTTGNWYDELVVMDTTGSSENDFLGSGVAITGHNVTAAGDSAQWTPSAGSNFENVDEADPDDDTTYNSSSTAGQLDLYNIGNLPAFTGSVLSASIYGLLRKDSGGAEQAKLAIKTNSTVYYGSNESLTNSYAFYRKQYDTNPNTAAKFTQGEIDALQVGVEVV